MNPTEPLVLAEAVTLVPVSELDPVLQAQIEAEDGDFAITRERSRRTTRVIDRSGAELLEEFRGPSSVPDAITRFATKAGRAPGAVLQQSFELLSRMVRDGFLIPATSSAGSSLGPVESTGQWQVLEPLRLLEDTEVYLVSSPAGDRGVLKRVAPNAAAWIHSALKNEALVLHRLRGKAGPELLEDGSDAETPYLVVRWCPGVPSLIAATQIRRPWIAAARARIAGICASMLDRYVELHELGYLHGDVQPTNVLIDLDSGAASLIDFGLAVEIGTSQPGKLRGGVAAYTTPELAEAALVDDFQPHVTAASEQYSVAVLVYKLLTGKDYLEPRLDVASWHRAVCTEMPRSFVQVGSPPWTEMENVLGRALAKLPADRFRSMSEFRQAFARVARRAAVDRAVTTVWQPPRLFDSSVARLLEAGAISRALPRPTANVNFGAAGIAGFLLRSSGVLQRPDLLAAADLWIERAKREDRASPENAFYDRSRGLDESTVGRRSFYHSVSGMHWMDAQIAIACDQRKRLSAAIDAFVSSARVSDPRADLVSGTAGLVLACASLIEALDGVEMVDERDRLRGIGDQLIADLLAGWGTIDEALPGTSEAFLGVAHGWAGAVYAIVRYASACGEPVPQKAVETLRSLAGAAQRTGDCVYWPIGSMNEELGTGWCHGTSGHALLWTEVQRSMPYDELGAAELAMGAAEHIWQAQPPSVGHLCCGAAGQGYAFLALYRMTGDGRYVDRARDRLQCAVGFAGTHGMLPESLYKGELGVALLEMDLAEPHLAAMPMFESERWV